MEWAVVDPGNVHGERAEKQEICTTAVLMLAV